MELYEITLDGCDDWTVIQKSLSTDEARFLTELSQEVNKASRSQCMPTLKVKKL